MVNSWKECSETTFELTIMKHVKVMEETEEVLNLVGNCSMLDKITKGQGREVKLPLIS
jgi:hypothetical protein